MDLNVQNFLMYFVSVTNLIGFIGFNSIPIIHI